MPAFSRSSLHRLRTCDPRLQLVFRRVVEFVDCTILEGHRGQKAQDRAFEAGRSKVQWPNGNHNAYPSRAVDAAPYPIDWGGPLVIDGELERSNLNALLRFYWFAGFVIGTAREMHVPLRWGGDWDRDFDFSDQSFNDLVHYELED